MKKIIYSLCIMLLCFSELFAQQQPSFEKVIIKDQDGTIYWPLSLPVFIELSSSAEGTDRKQLSKIKDEKKKAFGFPFKWDGPGLHYMRHMDLDNVSAESRELDFPVNVDGKAPTTGIKLSGAPTFVGDKIYYGKGLSTTLSALDDMAGVMTTQYSINGNNYGEYKQNINLDRDQEVTVRYFSVDRVGNVEEPKSKVFTVDVTTPNSKHTFSVDHLQGEILSPRSLISLESSDNLSGVKNIKSRFDNGTLLPYNSKINTLSLSDGVHRFSYFATDRVENAEEERSFSFYLDKNPPLVTSSLSSNYVLSNGKMFVAKTTRISLVATDNKAGVKDIFYSVNGGNEQRYSAPFLFPQKQGAFNIRFSAIDNVNNKGQLLSDENLGNVFLDDTQPTLSHEIGSPRFFSRDTLFITSQSRVNLKNIDNESGSAAIQYAVNGEGLKNYATPFVLETAGVNKVVYKGWDKVENIATKSFMVVVDNEAPIPSAKFSVINTGHQSGIPVYPKETLVYLGATDNVSGTKEIFYSLNDLQTQTYTQALKLSTIGQYKLKIWALDNLGTKSQEKIFDFIVR
jgi:hypothetical protein